MNNTCRAGHRKRECEIRHPRGPGRFSFRSMFRTGGHRGKRPRNGQSLYTVLDQRPSGCGRGRWSGESDLELLNPSGPGGSSGSNLGSRLSYPVTDLGHIPLHGKSQRHAILPGSGP